MKIKQIFSLAIIVTAGISGYSQVGIGTEEPKATLDIAAGTDTATPDGILIPRISKERAAEMAGFIGDNAVETSTLVFINDIAAGAGISVEDVTAPGYYYYNGTKWVGLASGSATNIETDEITIVERTGDSKLAQKFFYMPSIAIDVSTVPSTGNTINLYTEYVNQFGLVNTDTSAASTASPIPVYTDPEDLDYYVTYYDDTVFENVTVNSSGILQYDVIGTATDKTFMNIVFAVK